MSGVKALERKLGFHCRLGTSERTKQTTKKVLSLIKTIDRLTASYWSTTEATLRQSDVFCSDVNAVFDRFGHSIWPAGDRKSIEWLALAEEDNLMGDYPRDLFCNDERDQSILRSTFYDFVIAKCRTERVTRLRLSQNEANSTNGMLSHPDESDEDGNEASNNTIPDEPSNVTPAPDDDTSNDPDYQPFPRTSEPNPSPRNVNGRGHGRQHKPKTSQARSSRRLSRCHWQHSARDENNEETQSWTGNSSVGTSRHLKRRRQPSKPPPVTAPTANMSRRTATRSIVTLKVDPQKLSALLRGAHSDPTIPGNTNEVRIKNEVGPDKLAAECGTMRKASRPEVLLELKITTSPVIDLTDETPESLGESDQTAVAVDAGGQATIVPPTPVSLVQNLTPTASVGGQASSQIHSVQPAASELDTIAVFPTRLEELIADSLGAVVTGEASHANVVDAYEEQRNEPRPTDPERCMPRQAVGTASNDEEDSFSSTPPPPNVHSRDTNEPTATAQMLQPEPLDDRERPRENDDSREQGVHHADQTRLRGAGGQLASPVSTGAESGHRVAGQVADESQQKHLLSTMEQRVRQLQAAKRQYLQAEQSVKAREGQSRAQLDAMSRWIEREEAELRDAYQELERRSQTAARMTEAVEAMKRILQASSST
ncbi:hypothetical protein KC349_g8884 [Hortaea werneckii]|nr:hypothetical protein KC349_g8884 [Hortaea werneckii]